MTMYSAKTEDNNVRNDAGVGANPPRGIGTVSPYSSGTAVEEFGLLRTVAETDSASNSNRDTDGRYFEQDSAATTDDHFGLQCAAGGTFSLINNPVLKIKIKPIDLTNIRYFFGFSDTNLNNSLDNDDPTNRDMIGISFSTSNTDTNLQVLHNKATSAGVTRVDTGVSPVASTAYWVYLVGTSGTDWVVKLMDASFTELFTTTVTTNMPNNGDNMRVIIGAQTLNATTKQMRFYWAEAEQDI